MSEPEPTLLREGVPLDEVETLECMWLLLADFPPEARDRMLVWLAGKSANEARR